MNMDRTTDFLRRCANLPSMGGERREWPKPQSVQHLCKKYSEFVWNAPWPIFTWKAVSELKALLGIQEQSEEYDRLMLLYFQICFLRHALRAVWGAHNERDAFWKMVGIVSEFIEYVGADRAVAETMDFGKLADLFLPPAMPQALENAIWTLFKEKQRGRARICENPDCPARYYFAVRRDQRFCSAECAKPAQQAAKRTWWNQKGSAWRERKRREKASKPSGRKRS